MDKLLEKLNKLDTLEPTTKQLWGKMSAQHMVEHLILAVKMSNGKLSVECFNQPEKIPTLKRFMMSSRPLPKDFINPIIGEGLLPLTYKNLDEAKSILKSETQDFYDYFAENPEAIFTNPTFGDLNKAEWDVFHEKHFRHHFAQFGINND